MLASTDLVAATLCSRPAATSMTAALSAASGEPGSLTMARQKAPAPRAMAVWRTRSGLRPDCEMAMNSAPAMRCRAP